MIRVIGCMALAALTVTSESALAQNLTAYESGLRLAQRRGYANAECYGRVFAKHAVVVEDPSGRRAWQAASTPAYNAEQRRRCGVDRLTDLAERRQAQQTSSLLAPRIGRSAYRAGLNLAAKRGHTGSNASCYARTFARFASASPSENGAATYSVYGLSMNAYTAELFRNCGISR